MTRDTELARHLTDAVTDADGVIAIFPVRPLLKAATEGIAQVLDLPVSDVLIDVTSDADLTTITAHVGVSAALPTPQTLSHAANTLRMVAAEEGIENTMIFVKARLIATQPRPQTTHADRATAGALPALGP